MWRVFTVTGMLGLAVACAHDTAPTEAEMARLRREMYDLRRDLDEAQDEIGELRDDVRALRRTPRRRLAEAKAPEVDLMPSRELPVVRVSAEGSDGDIDERGALDDGSPPIMIKLGPSAKEKVQVNTAVLARPDPVLGGGSPPPKEQYAEALRTLRDDDRPADARAMFLRFEREHPKSALADNAAYWAAMADFEQGSYAQAAEGFERMTRSYPRSNKVPFALVRWAEAELRLSRTADGVQRLELVVRHHSESPAADDARRLLAKVRAGKESM